MPRIDYRSLRPKSPRPDTPLRDLLIVIVVIGVVVGAIYLCRIS